VWRMLLELAFEKAVLVAVPTTSRPALALG